MIEKEKEGGGLKKISLAYVPNLLIVSSFLGRFFGPVLRAGGRLWSWVRCGRRRPKVDTYGLFLKKEERFNTDGREKKKKYILLDCRLGHVYHVL